MITDKLVNIDKYSEIPANIKAFIKGLSKDLQVGRLNISDDDYANVDEYTTKTHDNCRFEAHKKYADIQILLSGTERLDYSTSKGHITESYDENRDVMFAEAKETASVILDGTNFVMYFPEELHKPQMCVDNPEKIKKIVVKVKI